jgi:hypothetical protein
MSQIDPIMGSIVQAPAAQRLQESEKSRQIRHSSDLRRNATADSEEEVQESVSSPDELQPSPDQQKKGQKRKGTYSRQKPPKPQEDEHPDGLDLTA